MQFSSTISLVLLSAVFSGSVKADCASKIAVDTCEMQYKTAIDARCSNSSTRDSCYCTEMPSLVACFDFCSNDANYVAKRENYMASMTNYCTTSKQMMGMPPSRPSGSSASAVPSMASKSVAVSNVALFATSSGSISVKTVATETSTATDAKAASVSKAVSAASSSASASVSKALNSSSKNNSNSTSDGTLGSKSFSQFPIFVIGSLIAYRLA